MKNKGGLPTDEQNEYLEEKENLEEKKVSRRQVTKKLLAGGGIVSAATMNTDRWVKPVVDSTVLPAHADTSEDEELPEEAPEYD